MVPPAKRKLVYSSESEDETQFHPVRRSRVTRGRGSGWSPVMVTPTTTIQPTPLSASEFTSTASTGVPAASRSTKTSRGSSTGRAGRSTVRGRPHGRDRRTVRALSTRSQPMTTTVSLHATSSATSTTASTTSSTTSQPSTSGTTTMSPGTFYVRKMGVRVQGKGKSVPVKTTLPTHCTTTSPTAPCQSHIGSTTSLTPSKFVAILASQDDFSDGDEDLEAKRQGWVIDSDSGEVGDSSDDADDISVHFMSDQDKEEDEDVEEHQQQNPQPEPSHSLIQEFQWTPGDNFMPQLHDFDPRNSGLTSVWPCGPEATEKDFFRAFFDDDILGIIVDETNKYYAWVMQNTRVITPRSYFAFWVDTTLQELLVFMALVLVMPLIKKHALRDYWKRDPMIPTPLFPKFMSRDRFMMLMSFLHFTNNDQPNKEDRLWKIRPIMSMILNNYRKYFYPFRKVVIDESLMLFKGRVAFKQYIPSKRHRFGVKLFVLCDCETGFILDCIVYSGTDTDIPKVRPGDPLGLSGHIVKKLMEPYIGSGHVLFTDNWYSSPYLCEYLHERKTGMCGTVKAKRKYMPKFHKDDQVLLPHPSSSETPDTEDDGKITAHIKRRQKRAKNPRSIIRRQTDKILAIKWTDRRDVHLLSTIHKGKIDETGKNHYKTGKPIKKPDVVIDYVENMRLIDKSDCMLSGVECLRKCTKWYQKLFFHLVDLTMLNAYNAWLVARYDPTKPKIKFREFVYNVSYQLLEEQGNVTSLTRGRRSTMPPDRLQGAAYVSRHHLALTPKKPGENRHRLVECAVCKLKNKRTRVTSLCPECDVGLCLGDCFVRWHTQKNP